MPDRKVIAQEFVNLKNRVRNEMRRRNGYGSMVSYADAKYDFKNSALPNTLLRLEYMTQNQIPLRAVSASQLPENIKLVITESDMAAMEAKITAYESQPRGARTNNDCDAMCSGMCVTQCTTTCSGSCTGTCSGGCSGSCSGGCSGDCYGGCGGCGWGCSGGCSSGCGGCDNKGCGPSCGYCTCNPTCHTCGSGCSGRCSWAVQAN